mmetsp:Transcript_144449/g.251823  ORF Transcript_144449/g.251823 Transcript_144449/m.251823 type:complete len:482 (+) Transcript_144449:65-1510(+)
MSVEGKKLYIILSGSRGDFQPWVAVSVKLVRAGFKVAMASNPEHEPIAKAAPVPIEFFSNGCSFKDYFVSEAAQKAYQGDSVPAYAAALDAWRKTTAGPEAVEVLKGIDAFKPDAIISCGPMHEETSKWIPRLKRIPALETILMPVHFCADMPPMSFLPNLPCGLNKIYAKAFADGRQKWYTFYGKAVEEYSGKPMSEWASTDGDFLYACGYGTPEQQASADPVLCLAFPEFAKKSTDPDTMIYTGYPFMTEHKSDTGAVFGAAQSQLDAFLAAGAPPVYVGYGSMKTAEPTEVTTRVVKALKLAEARGVILGGWGGLSLDALTDPDLSAYAEKNCIFTEGADHMALFPKCAVLVHHGGHGTTQTSIRAGTPTIVTPMHLDQKDHGKMLQDNGIGKVLKNFLKNTPEELGKAIAEVMADDAMKAKCKEAAATVAKTDGAQAAADYIKKWYTEKVVTGEQMKKVDADWEAMKSTKKGGCTIL